MTSWSELPDVDRDQRNQDTLDSRERAVLWFGDDYRDINYEEEEEDKDGE